MTTGIIHGEKHIEKQMGCMAGFFQLFDRHHILAGKRLYSSTKRLTYLPSPVNSIPPQPERPKQTKPDAVPPPPENPTPAKKMIPVTEIKEATRSPWKFGKEAPRLSLDSRATVDNKGKLYAKVAPSEIDGGDEKRRSTSVIARLMGLEPLSESPPETARKAELRRSASESRVSKDLSRFMNLNLDRSSESSRASKDLSRFMNLNLDRSFDNSNNNNNYHLPTVSKISQIEDEKTRTRPWRSPRQQRKNRNYFDSEDSFPEPKQNGSIYNEIERRLKMRGIDEPCKDLQTLKQILEAMQLKGLLRNRRPDSTQMNYIYTDNNYKNNNNNIVLMKPARSRTPPPRRGGERDKARNNCSPTRRENSAKNSPNCSPVRRRPISGVDNIKMRTNDFSDQRKANCSPLSSPRLSPRKVGSDMTMGNNNNRSPRNRRLVVDTKEKLYIDESSSITESTVSTSSQTDTERSKIEVNKGGRNLLERCDKLLNSIAEMTAADLQPSPVSVLDSSFYKDDSSSPSPIMKRSIDFKDREFEEDMWSPMFSPIQSQKEDTIRDCDYAYISDILHACNYLPDDSDMFLLLEKQQYLKGNDTSKTSKLKRRLIFDTINEILDRNRQFPPWKLPLRPNFGEEKPLISQIWSDFLKIRERDLAEEDLFDTICSVLRKDLEGDSVNGWGDCHVEMSEAVLDIERLIFKDLVGETIQDIATLGGLNMLSALRRKLVF